MKIVCGMLALATLVGCGAEQPNSETKDITNIEAVVKNVSRKGDITIKVNGKPVKHFDFHPRTNKVSATISLTEGTNSIIIDVRNASAKASAKANIPAIGLTIAPPADSTKILPTIGPVHEKETIARVSAIRKIPIMPPRSLPLLSAVLHEEGSVISNMPKKESANTKMSANNAILNPGLTDN